MKYQRTLLILLLVISIAIGAFFSIAGLNSMYNIEGFANSNLALDADQVVQTFERARLAISFLAISVLIMGILVFQEKRVRRRQ